MRLGDLDKAEAVLRNIADHLKECGQDGLWPATYAAADVIKQQRTIDAVPVVRCKDCVVPHNKWTGCPMLNGAITPPDFYCSYGERKGGDG